FTVIGQPGSNTDLLVQTQVRGGTLIKEGAGVMELDTGGTGEVGNPVPASVRAGTLLLDRGLDGNVTVRNNGTVRGGRFINGDLSTLDGAVVTMDDRDSGFTATAGWGLNEFHGGFLNSFRQARPSTSAGVQTASWTFTGLTPGLYRVFATWTSGP